MIQPCVRKFLFYLSQAQKHTDHYDQCSHYIHTLDLDDVHPEISKINQIDRNDTLPSELSLDPAATQIMNMNFVKSCLICEKASLYEII